MEQRMYIKKRLKDLNAVEYLEEMKECDKELKVYNDLQKVFSIDYLDYCRWTDQIAHRKTLLGKVTYYLGKIVAVTYLVRLFFSAKNLLYPVYNSDRISNNVRRTLTFFHLYKEEDELFWQLTIQYLSLTVIGVLIATNIRSFLSNLLKTIKNCLRDQLIQLSYNTTTLVFSFIMGSYYLSILLQLSMNLPEKNQSREAFSILLDKFSPEFIFYTFDCTFIISSLLGTVLLYSNWYIKKFN